MAGTVNRGEKELMSISDAYSYTAFSALPLESHPHQVAITHLEPNNTHSFSLIASTSQTMQLKICQSCKFKGKKRFIFSDPPGTFYFTVLLLALNNAIKTGCVL